MAKPAKPGHPRKTRVTWSVSQEAARIVSDLAEKQGTSGSHVVETMIMALVGQPPKDYRRAGGVAPAVVINPAQLGLSTPQSNAVVPPQAPQPKALPQPIVAPKASTEDAEITQLEQRLKRKWLEQMIERLI
jgi:hypothetical protein